MNRDRKPEEVARVQALVDHAATLVEGALQAEGVEYEKKDEWVQCGIIPRKHGVGISGNTLRVIVHEHTSNSGWRGCPCGTAEIRLSSSDRLGGHRGRRLTGTYKADLKDGSFSGEKVIQIVKKLKVKIGAETTYRAAVKAQRNAEKESDSTAREELGALGFENEYGDEKLVMASGGEIVAKRWKRDGTYKVEVSIGSASLEDVARIVQTLGE